MILRYGIVLSLIAGFMAFPLHSRAAERPGALELPCLAVDGSSPTAEMLDPQSETWNEAPQAAIHLNRTPSLYGFAQPDTGERPEASVRIQRLNDGTAIVRIRWSDATQDRSSTATAHPDGGEAHIYKRHSRGLDEFGDAVCIMVPEQRGPHAAYPSMMMGETTKPVTLYFWRAGSGFQILRAHGRASPANTKEAASGRVVRDSDGWSATFAIPKMVSRTPLCFAIWNGARGHRDGIKYFSLWYEIQ